MASTTELVTESVTDLTKEKLENGKKEEEKTFRTMTMKERWSYIREVTTIEPLLTCYLMASVLCVPALNQLEFEKGCKSNLEYNDTICDSIIDGTYELLNFTTETDNVQQLIIQMHSWQQPLQSVMPIILVLFLGSYSDRHKIRKPFLLIPIAGEFLAVAGCILSVIFMEQWRLEIQGFMQTVVPSFLGGPTMILMACFAYIADVSTIEMRTLRIGIVQIVLNVSTPIVQSFSGVLFAEIGYIGILLCAGVLYLIGFVYGIFLIKEPKQAVDVEDKKGLIKDIFDPRHAIETLKLLVKKTEGNKRLDVILIVVILFIYSGVNAGEGSVFYLFTVKTYYFTTVDFSYFLTFNTVIHLIGTIIALAFFTKVYQLSDLIIASIAFLDKIASNVVIIIFLSSAGLYAGTVVSFLIAISSIAIRSQATKVVSEDDLGKAQSIFAIVEAIAPAAIIPIYNQGIYSVTLESYPPAFFYLGIILYGLGIVALMWMYMRDRKQSASKKNEAAVNGIELDAEVNGNAIESTRI